jgi:hypothetical protein
MIRRSYVRSYVLADGDFNYLWNPGAVAANGNSEDEVYRARSFSRLLRIRKDPWNLS